MPPEAAALELKAFDYVADITKLVISLGTGVLAFTVTFARESGKALQADHSIAKKLSRMWLLYGTSIGFGLLTLLMLAGRLGRKLPDIYAINVRIASSLQLVSFGVASFYLWFVGKSILAALGAASDEPNTAPSSTPEERL